MKYYYRDPNGQTIGPYDEAELRRLNVAGVVTPDTYVCQDGGTAWQPFRAFMALSYPSAANLPPPPPPPKKKMKKKMKTEGWILFGVLVLFCLPLCWIPFTNDRFYEFEEE